LNTIANTQNNSVQQLTNAELKYVSGGYWTPIIAWAINATVTIGTDVAKHAWRQGKKDSSRGGRSTGSF